MAADTRTEATDKFFDAVVERQATIFDAFRAASDRYHRFNRSVVEGARMSSKDWTEVGRRAITNPRDMVAVYEAMSEAVSNQQQRNLALVREWIEDRVEAQRESREVLRQGIGDVREVVERAQSQAPEFLRNITRRRAVTNGNGRAAKAKSKA